MESAALIDEFDVERLEEITLFGGGGDGQRFREGGWMARGCKI